MRPLMVIPLPIPDAAALGADVFHVDLASVARDALLVGLRYVHVDGLVAHVALGAYRLAVVILVRAFDVVVGHFLPLLMRSFSAASSAQRSEVQNEGPEECTCSVPDS